MSFIAVLHLIVTDEHRLTKYWDEQRLTKYWDEHRLTKYWDEHGQTKSGDEHRLTKYWDEHSLAKSWDEHRLTKYWDEHILTDFNTWFCFFLDFISYIKDPKDEQYSQKYNSTFVGLSPYWSHRYNAIGDISLNKTACMLHFTLASLSLLSFIRILLLLDNLLWLRLRTLQVCVHLSILLVCVHISSLLVCVHLSTLLICVHLSTLLVCVHLSIRTPCLIRRYITRSCIPLGQASGNQNSVTT